MAYDDDDDDEAGEEDSNDNDDNDNDADGDVKGDTDIAHEYGDSKMIKRIDNSIIQPKKCLKCKQTTRVRSFIRFDLGDFCCCWCLALVTRNASHISSECVYG